MESSSSADQREDEEERHPALWHSPCHFFELLITSCLKCLGLDANFPSFSSSADAEKTKTDHEEQYPPPQTETEMKHGEEVVVIATSTARSTRSLGVKRPGTGSGPHINRASS